MRAARGPEQSGGNQGSGKDDCRWDRRRSRSKEGKNDRVQYPLRGSSRDRGSRARNDGGDDRRRNSPGERSRDRGTEANDQRKSLNWNWDRVRKDGSRSRSQQERRGSEDRDSYYGSGEQTTVGRSPTPPNVPEDRKGGGGQEETGGGGVTPVLASPQEEEGKKKKRVKKDRVKVLAPDHDSEEDSSGSEDMEDENDRLKEENTLVPNMIDDKISHVALMQGALTRAISTQAYIAQQKKISSNDLKMV